MYRKLTAVAALAALGGLAACGSGNPFTTTTDTTTDDGTITASTAVTVPTTIANDLTSIDFDSATNTLTVTGLTQDGVPQINSGYRRITDGSISAPGYEVFTAQNDSLGRHATAFVASRNGVQAGVVMTGGQFNKFFGGTYFDREGNYVAPVSPDSRFDVTYSGRYAAGLNGVGPVTDLLAVDPSVDPDVDRPVQTAYTRGLIFLNVDLSDMSVEGEIFDRTSVFTDGGTGQLFGDNVDLVLVEGTLAANGTFSGNIELDQSDTTDAVVGVDVGDFAGVIGGPNGEFIAGGTQLADFNTNIDNEIEYGVFVLDMCTATSTDPICVGTR